MSKKSKVKQIVGLTVPAGAATPGPPIGTALGPKGVNLGDFCKKINDATSKFEKNTPIPVVLTIYEDRTFSFITKAPPASFLLKKAAGIEKGASTPNKETVGTITNKQLYEIAQVKAEYMTSADIDAAARSIKGSAKSMGIKIVD